MNYSNIFILIIYLLILQIILSIIFTFITSIVWMDYECMYFNVIP